MDLSLKPVEVDDIRTDGGTQVREGLNEEWVAELSELYADTGHDIEPIVVMFDGSAFWLVDGFHRLAAAKRAGLTGLAARVREGTLDQATLLACRMNRGGMRWTSGDKKRAVLLALSTKEGKKWGVRELARHCGISKSHVANVLSGVDHGRPVPDTDTGRAAPAPEFPKNRKRSVTVLWARIDAAVRENPDRIGTEIAKELGCDASVVRRRRREIGLPMDRSRANKIMKGKAAPLPSAPDAQAPSAPSRKKNDPREGGAQVITLRPKTSPRNETDKKLVEEIIQRLERLSDDGRDLCAQSLRRRWPAVFGETSATVGGAEA
jgi:transposase-like protein